MRLPHCTAILGSWKQGKPNEKWNVNARRTAPEQEVLARIAPLAKLGRFEAAVDFFQVNVLQLAYRVGGYEPIPPGQL